MAWPRASESDVKNVVDTGATTAQVDAALSAGERVIEDNLVGEGVADATLTEIHTYLGGHFLQAVDPQTEEERHGDHQEKYQGSTSEGLKSTWLGQMAISLDPTGILASLPERKGKARFRIGSQ